MQGTLYLLDAYSRGLISVLCANNFRYEDHPEDMIKKDGDDKDEEPANADSSETKKEQ